MSFFPNSKWVRLRFFRHRYRYEVLFYERFNLHVLRNLLTFGLILRITVPDDGDGLVINAINDDGGSEDDNSEEEVIRRAGDFSYATASNMSPEMSLRTNSDR